MKQKRGFTLVEIMVGILIFSIVIIGGFQAYNGVAVGKIKLIESTNIQKEAFYFSEKFFEEIKKGGTIDYEEYFNRSIVGTATSSGHYRDETGFGNFGSGTTVPSGSYGGVFYYCRSGDGTLMGTGGCVDNNDLRTSPKEVSEKQRYGQYSLQFIDYNSNADADLGDEDGNGSIFSDDDDEYLGRGPVAFSGSEVKEIYLISADKRKRTFFRWNIKDDPNTNLTCDFSTGSGGCLSTIEFLKLNGKDWGIKNHDKSGKGLYDGVVDTWLIHEDFTGGTEVIAGSDDSNQYWQPLFSDDIKVTDVKFFVYPNKDLDLAWRDDSTDVNIAPYVRVQMTLSPSYKARRGIKGEIPRVKVNTTISLSDIYSR